MEVLFLASIELQNAINGYEKYILANGIDEQVIDAYVLAVQTSYKEDKGTGLKVSARAKEIIEQFVLDKTGGTVWDLDSYCNQNKVSYGILDSYYQVLLAEAPHLFDSYLLYLEKDREEKEKFYFPKMIQLRKLGIIQAMQDLEDDVLDYLSISMPPGTQKAQPLYSKVLTPSGWKKMGDVCVGDKVISGTGNVCNVTGVYPQGIKPIYEVYFDDGSSCRCSDEHLWTVQTRDDRIRKNKDGSEKYRTISLNEIIKNYKVENGKRCNYSVDYVPQIDCFEKKEYLIDPYVIGALIGDGCLSSGNLNISTKDTEILEMLKKRLPKEYEFTYKGGCDYGIKTNCKKGNGKSELKKALEFYGLLGKTSIDKFIPTEYLFGNYQQRLDLLRGLMDTDGSAQKGYCVYATISKTLADNVRELVHSLGGYCSINKRKAGYKNGKEYIQCNDYYELIIEFSSEMDSIFFLKRKKDKYNPKRKTIKRFITDIKKLEDDYCQCIYIDDESHLYITDDYIITHNTTALKFFASWIIGKHPRDYSLFFSHSGDITRMFYDGVLDITTSEEYKWSEIFPEVKLRDTNAKAEKMDFGKYKPFYSLQCTSVGSKNSGKVRCNRYLYCDDLIGGIEEALNKARLDNLWNIYSVDARQRKLNEQVKEIHIATRWSVHDVIGRLKALFAGNNRAKFIAIPDLDPETGESNFNYKYNGMSKEFFEAQALVMDEVSYKCLYKNEPIEREGLLFPEDSLRRYFALPKETPDEIIGQCDTKGKGTDYMVLPCLYRYGDDYYCEDAVCNNSADYEQQYQNLSRIIVENQMNSCDFERNAGGDRVALEVSKRVSEMGWICNITDTPTETNKEARIYQCSNWIKQHILFKDKSMYSPKSDYGNMMSLLVSYSVSGKNPVDDVPDCFATFALRITKGSRVAKVEAIANPFRGGYGRYDY